MGAMLMKIVIILRENESHMAKNLVFDGGDASENCDFQRGKQRLQGTKFSDLSFYLQKEFFIDIIFFKYAIFIKFWCGAKFSNITKWQYFLDDNN